MIIKKNTATTLLGGTILSLAFAAAPLQAGGNDGVQSDVTVAGTEVVAAKDAAMMDEKDAAMMDEKDAAMMDEKDAAMMDGKVEADMEKMADETVAGTEAMTDAVEEDAQAMAAMAKDAAHDDDTAAMIQQRLDADTVLGVYQLSVMETEGRYEVSGMIDKSEDYAALQQLLGDIDGVDGSMIDNKVGVQ